MGRSSSSSRSAPTQLRRRCWRPPKRSRDRENEREKSATEARAAPSQDPSKNRPVPTATSFRKRRRRLPAARPGRRDSRCRVISSVAGVNREASILIKIGCFVIKKIIVSVWKKADLNHRDRDRTRAHTLCCFGLFFPPHLYMQKTCWLWAPTTLITHH